MRSYLTLGSVLILASALAYSYEALSATAGDGPAGYVTAPTEEVVLFDGTNLDEWNFFTEASGVKRDELLTVKDGVLGIPGQPSGYLATRRWYRDYALDLDWRWPGERGGNSGVLVHTTAPFIFYTWPRSIEVQLQAGSAGDFWVIGDGVELWVENMDTRRAKPVEGDLHTHRRIANLTDGSEHPIGEWNHMRIESRGDTLHVWVNGELVNEAKDCTVTEGAISLQSEGTAIEFRDVRVGPLQYR